MLKKWISIVLLLVFVNFYISIETTAQQKIQTNNFTFSTNALTEEELKEIYPYLLNYDLLQKEVKKQKLLLKTDKEIINLLNKKIEIQEKLLKEKNSWFDKIWLKYGFIIGLTTGLVIGKIILDK